MIHKLDFLKKESQRVSKNFDTINKNNLQESEKFEEIESKQELAEIQRNKKIYN